MPETLLAGGSRSHRPRLLPRKKLLVWLVLPTVLAVAATVVLVRITRDKPRYGAQAELIAELRGLVGENGLFMRPGLSSEGAPSWPDSAYGLGALAAAGAHLPPPADPAAAGTSLQAEVAADPIWSRWYGAQVERSTGVPIPGSWANGLLDKLALPPDPAGQIATIAAIAEVARQKAVPVPEADAEDLSRRLTAAVAVTPGPYSRCRAVEAAKLLDVDVAAWHVTVPEAFTPPQAMSAEAVMDAFGVLCLAEQLGTPAPAQLRQRLVRWLEPHLGMGVAGFEFETYYVVRAWLMAGGDRPRLDRIVDQLQARYDRPTGLLRGHVTRLGTLENTYFTAVLADSVDAFDDIAPKRTVDAVRRLVPEVRAKSNVTDLLMCAVVLKYAGARDGALEAEAADAAARWLAAGVRRDTVVPTARVVTLLQQLGRPVPRLTATTFPVATAEDRFLGWTLLGLAAHLDNAAEVRQRLADVAAGVGPALASPDQLMVQEVAAAMAVPGSGVDRNALPDKLTGWADAVRGCAGFRALYRPVRAESRCTLEATAQMLAAGLVKT